MLILFSFVWLPIVKAWSMYSSTLREFPGCTGNNITSPLKKLLSQVAQSRAPIAFGKECLGKLSDPNSLVKMALNLKKNVSCYCTIIRRSVGSFHKWWYPQSASVLLGFSIINHPCWGSTIYGNPRLKIVETPLDICPTGSKSPALA